MMMDHQPLIADEFEEICREDLGLLGFVGLVGGQIFDANDPGHVAGDLDHDIRELKLHRKGIVEDEDPRVTHGRPSRTECPSWMNTGDIFLMHPDLIHLRDVETFEGIVEFLVGFGDGLNALFQHVAPLSQWGRIILQPMGPRRGDFSGALTTHAGLKTISPYGLISLTQSGVD